MTALLRPVNVFVGHEFCGWGTREKESEITSFFFYLDKGMINCGPLSFVYLYIYTDLWYWFSTTAVTLHKFYFLHLLTCISRFHPLQFQVKHCTDFTCSGQIKKIKKIVKFTFFPVLF